MKKAVLILVAVVAIASCTRDEIPPSITSLNLEMNDTVSNIYSIELEATDNDEINKIELFINDSLVQENKNIPFIFNWNTLNINDGKYSVRVVVTDTEGNTAESSSDVFVNNNLLTIDAGDIYFCPHFVVVADEEGNVLDTAVLKRNTVTVLKPEKPFDGKAINFIWLRKGLGATFMSANVHIKRGSVYKLMHYQESPPFKYVKIHFVNDIPSFSGIVINTDLHFYNLSSIADTATIPNPFPYTAGHKLLIQLFTSEGRFYKFFDIDDKPDITVNLSTITGRQEHKTISFPTTGEAGYTIYGVSKESDLLYRYLVSHAGTNMTGHSLELWYPAEYFIKYSTALDFIKYGTTRSYSDFYNGQIPNVYNQSDADVQIMKASPGDFSATLSGRMDFYVVDFRNEDRSVQFSVTSPVSCNSWKLPDPGTIFNDNTFSLSRYHPDFITISEFESLEFRDKYYDLDVDIQKLNRNEPHYQMVFISLYP